jgi:hypothetical protein
MREVLGFIVPLLVRLAFSFAVVMLDERRLTEAQLERAWPPTSRASALVNFDVIALVLHFVRTRYVGPTLLARLRGAAIGLLWAAGALVVVLGATYAAMAAVALAFGEPLE